MPDIFIRVTTVDEHKRPIYIRADKVVSLLKVKNGTHIECEGTRMVYCIEYIDDVKAMIEHTLKDMEQQRFEDRLRMIRGAAIE